MSATTDFTPIRRWYTGKALANLDALLPALAASEAQGYWVPGISRKVHAALTKISTATKNAGKFANACYDTMCSGDTYGTPVYKAGHAWASISHALAFGHPRDVVDSIKIVEKIGKPSVEQKIVLATARDFAADLGPVWALVKKLDDTRPAPVFTSLGLSPTVTKTLTEQLKLDVKTLRFPEMIMEWVDVTIMVSGKLVVRTIPKIKIVWPNGTVHGRSRFAKGGQCHACGHAIRNSLNWVPFLIDDAHGVPHSFWVGRDCARSIFNVDMKGDAEYAEGSRP